jgi:hypothetical protein
MIPTTDPRVTLAALVQRPEAAGEVAPAAIPALLAALAGLQGALLARLVVESRHNDNGSTAAVAPADDKLLTADEAAPILGVAPRWLYRHAGQLPFTRRLSRKVLRFSEAGLRRYAATRRARL